MSAKPNAMVLFNTGFGARNTEGKSDIINNVKPNQPPCIQFFGTEDPRLSRGLRFQEAYKKAGNRCELITYEGEDHGFYNQRKYLGLTLAETDRFLVGLGWLLKKVEAQ